MIRNKVVSIGFGFRTPEELRRLSVKAITSPHAFDSLDQPVPGGLYDPHLGPLKQGDICVTCGLVEVECLGHVGHIDLCIPLFQPLLFKHTFLLMGLLCFKCHYLRANRFKVKLMVTCLRLLQAGLLEDAIACSQMAKVNLKQNVSPTKRKGKVVDGDVLDAEEGESGSDPDEGQDALQLRDVDQMLDKYLAKAKTVAKLLRKPVPMCQNVAAFRKRLVREFLGKMRASRRCQNCKYISPQISKDGFSKMFQKPLSERDAKALAVMGLAPPESVFSEKSLKEDIEEQQGSRLDQKKKKKQQKKKKNHRSSSSDDSDDSDSPDASDAEMGQTGAEGATRFSGAKHGRMKLIFPHEVERHITLLFKKEAELLRFMWPCMPDMPALSYVRQQQLQQRVKGRDFAAPDPSICFIRTVCVAANRFRPPAFLNGQTFDNDQNVYLKKLISNNQEVQRLGFTAAAAAAPGINAEGEEEKAEVDMDRVLALWLDMQAQLNCLMDSSMYQGAASAAGPPGIKQLLERKQGLFRHHMMGKRVNFAARSVISPDPFILTSEIGVPVQFARTLTYQEPVTVHNAHELMEAVCNGPDVHPGANAIEYEDGRVVKLDPRSEDRRRALAKTLLTGNAAAEAAQAGAGSRGQNKLSARSGLEGLGVKRVFRHLRSGDILLANRQPTLHKPGIMAHRARIIRGQQTIRMHYANCNTYNADFDGDEMNLHFPQNELARAEAYTIANTANQYISGTNGSPLRGLIQDHVVSGVLLTKRDSFFTREDFQQLIWSCLASSPTSTSSIMDVGVRNLLSCSQGVGSDPNFRLRTPPPAIVRPQALWTGKQVVSCVLEALTADFSAPLSMTNSTKLPAAEWGGGGKDEGKVVIRDGELLCGVLDKNAFGSSERGLVHAVYELYGAGTAGQLLSVLGRLFTLHLRSYGHTCGIDDIILVSGADAERRKAISCAQLHGVTVARAFVGLDDDDQAKGVKREGGEGSGDALGTQNMEKLFEALQSKMRAGRDEASALLDSAMKGKLNTVTSEIIKHCLPVGQLKPFPSNMMSLMTLTGAKGSKVNFSQMACLLGQQELEGRRVPVMCNGKSLPSFRAYDPDPRAGGYITQRFLTGIKPQEYYFHCMAGREGLVDTAVKTARSGYLQRCLVKHLESLVVSYDNTVRDSDGSVIQFLYGEDLLDVTKATYLDQGQFAFLADNKRALIARHKTSEIFRKVDVESSNEYNEAVDEAMQRVQQWKAEQAAADEEWWSQKEELKKLKKEKKSKKKKNKIKREDTGGGDGGGKRFASLPPPVPDPITSRLPPGQYLGSVSEAFRRRLLEFLHSDEFARSKAARDKPPSMEQLVEEQQRKQRRFEAAEVAAQKSDKDKKKKSGKKKDAYTAADAAADAAAERALQDQRDRFELLMYVKYAATQVAPGEAVGCVAAQGVGEPSTQMTLNTFHLAGHGGANVTLGIPRLREIIMTASEQIATPVMELPLLPQTPGQPVSKSWAEIAMHRINRLRLIDFCSAIKTSERLEASGREVRRLYTVRLLLHPLDAEGCQQARLCLRDYKECLGTRFTVILNGLVGKELKTAGYGDVGKILLVNQEEEEDKSEGKPQRAKGKAKKKRPPPPPLPGSEAAEARAVKAEPGQDEDEDSDEGDAEEDENFEKRRRAASLVDDEAEEGEADEDSEVSEWRSNSLDKEEGLGAEEVEEEGEEGLQSRIEGKLAKCSFVKSITFSTDKEKGVWVECVAALPSSVKKLMMMTLAEKAVEATLIRSTHGVQKAFAVERSNSKTLRKEWVLQTDGVNFHEIWKHSDIIDVNKINSNDIGVILRVYGVEACRAAIVQNITSVFNVYGIRINPRHLGLIADYMTQRGGYRPLNRIGMTSNGSPLQKITFETSMQFLLEACMTGEVDRLTSPSAKIVVGQPPACGTGTFELLQRLHLK